jgi:hypothetical protein
MRHLRMQDLTWEPAADAGYTKARVPHIGAGFAACFYVIPQGCSLPRGSFAGYDYIHVVDGSVDIRGTRLDTNDFMLCLEGDQYEAVAVETATLLVITEKRQPHQPASR